MKFIKKKVSNKSQKKLSIKYEKKYVAFIDVLGFKEKLRGEVADLADYFNTVLEEIDALQKIDSKKKLDFILLSDAIILTFPKNDNSVKDLAELLIAISKIQWKLCQFGFWLRGAVTYGEIFIDRHRNVAVGPALADAYKLESMAIQPRVIVDPKILKLLNKNRSTLVQQVNRISESFGPSVLFHYGKSDLSAEILSDAMFVDYLAKVNFCERWEGYEIVNQIEVGMQSGQENYSKYRWLVAYALASLRDEDDEHYLLNSLLTL